MTDKKIALITGASRGIGKAVAIMLAKAGCDIIVNYAGNSETAEKTVEEIKALGVNCEAYKFDVSNQEEVNTSVAKILEKYGKIDILVNNAGITRDDLFIRMDADKWNAVINTNLNSAFYVSKPIVKSMMKQRSGVIISTSSVVGLYGNPGQANYSAAKAGLIGFTKSLAKELGSRNIRVNAVAPGFIQTDMTKDLPNIDDYMKMISLRRMGTAEDVAQVVKFLALDTTYVTGQVIEVDGGLII
ncbi:MAG: 3-oxoacyl-[acyl-carrier-protein] reductase [Clostridiaceae bacterium]|jgi:3-oxoacyl-[acyl-carrier protein] reductase|nr:3-oxoacyl-[acyl-carrier-protein] reductase [Clostridiaceae bacterium]